MKCEYCDFTAETEEQLDTHTLLKHEEWVDDSSDFVSEVSPGFFEERDHEKEERFGYN